MELDRFLNLCAAGTGALGSIYVLKSFLSLTPTATARLAQSGYGFTVSIIDSVSAQRAESIAGAAAFLLALLLGIAGIGVAPSDVWLFASKATAFVLAAIVVAAVWLCLHFVARSLRNRHNEAARMVILTETFDDVVNGGKFQRAYIDGVRQTAEALFAMQLPGANVDMMRSVAAKIGRRLPAGIAEGIDRKTTLQ